MGIEYINIYPKKLGIFIPDSSAIDFTIKLGAFPIYVFAPMNTAPREIPTNNFSNSGKVVLIVPAAKASLTAGSVIPSFPKAVLKKVKYVGALSRKLDSDPVTQKKCFGESIAWISIDIAPC